MLPEEHRLRKNSEFQCVFRRGRSFASEYLALHVMKRQEGICRFGFVASRKVGGAVTRNRIKRRLREAVKPFLHQIHQPADIVLIARKADAAALAA